MTAKAPPVIVLVGTASSVGKTTVALGLIEALRARGLVVQPFKVGPDFIDAGLHAVSAGRPSYNLDGWICGQEHVVDTVTSRGAGADLCLVEGAMCCFGGVDVASEDGSTAQVAKVAGRADRAGRGCGRAVSERRRHRAGLRALRPPPGRGGRDLQPS